MGKRIICFFAAVLAAVMMLSCGDSGSRAEQAETEEEREKIVLWAYYETDAQQNAMDVLTAGFNVSQDKYEASWEYVPMTEFTKKLTMAYTEQALPDLVFIDNPSMPMCIQMGMFEDITEFLQEMDVEEYYYPVLLQTVTYDGRMYGLPANCNNTALIYNKKMLEKAGVQPPETWEELEEAAKKLTTKKRDGFLMSGIEGEQGAFQLLYWILSAGEPMEEIGGEGTLKAFQFIYSLMEQGYMTRNCINLSQTDVARVFIQGGAAMMENGPWVYPMLDAAGMDYGVSALPVDQKRVVVAGGENLGILKGKNLEGAKLFLSYFNRNEVMKKFCETASALPTKTCIEAGNEEHMQVIREQMKESIARSQIPSWNTLSVKLTESFYRMAAREIKPERAVEELKRLK